MNGLELVEAIWEKPGDRLCTGRNGNIRPWTETLDRLIPIYNTAKIILSQGVVTDVNGFKTQKICFDDLTRLAIS
jgi:hypothetical protein